MDCIFLTITEVSQGAPLLYSGDLFEFFARKKNI